MTARQTIPEMILGVCARPGLSSKTALSFATVKEGAETLTYAELGAAVKEAASRLGEMGCRPGERVSLCSENRPLWAVAYLGILAAGCVCVPIDINLGERELREILSHSGSSLLLFSEKTAPLCESATDALEGRVEMTAIEDLVPTRKQASGGGAETVQEIGGVPSAEDDWADVSRDPHSEAVVIYTSGTTGRPKGVVLSHVNILSNVFAMTKAVHLTQDDVFLSVLPLNHTFECTAGLLAPLSDGARVAYATGLRPRDLSESMRTARPTMMLGVPLLFQKMILGFDRAIRRAPPANRIAGRTLYALTKALKPVFGDVAAKILMKSLRAKAGLDRARLLIAGAAPMPPSVARDFRLLGLTMIQGYGLTEASPVVAVNRPEAPKDETVGPALSGVEIAIDSPGDDGVGEILVKGDNVMLGYYRDPAETSKTISGGWLKTGDLGWIDDDGHLVLSGRIKSVIVSSAGKNIYPEELEEILLNSPFVDEVLVLGRSHGEGKGQQPHALVRPDRDAVAAHLGVDLSELADEGVQDLIRGEIRRLCAPLADYKKIRGFSIRDEEFPKTGTKKIRRYLFQEKETPV